MECYATTWQLWRERSNLKIFTEPSYPENAPLSLFICRDFSLFVPSTMCVQTSCPRDCNECMHSFNQLKGGWWKYNSLKFEEIPFMKNYGFTLIRGKNETSGRQVILVPSVKCPTLRVEWKIKRWYYTFSSMWFEFISRCRTQRVAFLQHFVTASSSVPARP